MTGAALPELVTHGFSLNDSRWLFGMLHTTQNPKVIENRAIRFAPGWYAVSLTQNAYTGITEEMEFRTEFPRYPGPLFYEKGRVLGLVRIGHSLPQAACKGHRWGAREYAVANIITEVLPFDSPGPSVRANFGTFPLKHSADDVRARAKIEAAAGHRRKTNAQAALPEQRGVWDSHEREARKAVGTTQAIKAAKALQLQLREHAPQKGKQVPKKPAAGAQTSAIAKRAQATVMAFARSPSLRASK